MRPARHQAEQQRSGHHQGEDVVLLRLWFGGENGLEGVALGEDQHGACGSERHHRRERHQDEAQQQAQDHSAIHSVIAMARNAMRSRADSFSVALLSWPQAARMSRPRGVRTGEA